MPMKPNGYGNLRTTMCVRESRHIRLKLVNYLDW